MGGRGLRSIRHASVRKYAWLALGALLLVGIAAVVHGDFAAAASERTLRPQTIPIAPPAQSPGRWIAAWAASPQAASPRSQFVTGFVNRTVRNVLFSTIGATKVRIRFTNAFGTTALEIGHATVAVHGKGAGLAPGTTRTVTFAGQSSIQIPPGADALSDPVALTVRPGPGARGQPVPAACDRAADRARRGAAVQLRRGRRPRGRRRRRRVHRPHPDVVPDRRCRCRSGLARARHGRRARRLGHRRRRARASGPMRAGPTTSPAACRRAVAQR